jgi:hypothetical protein
MDKLIYYHFLPYKYAKDDLEWKRIKVSTIDTLNDPFEFMPYRRFSEREKRKSYDDVFQAVSKKWGILCFSKIYTEQLLWAHYAEKHKGIALGFEIPEGRLLEVTYTPDEIRTKFELSNDPNDNEQKFLDLATIKFHEWKYEKEYRLLVPLKDCKYQNGYYYKYFGNNLKLSEIVFGCRCTDNRKVRIILELANQLRIDIVATRGGFEDYRIHRCGRRTPQYQNVIRNGFK